MSLVSRKLGWMILFLIFTLIPSAISIWNAVANDHCVFVYLFTIPFVVIFGIFFIAFLAAWLEARSEERKIDIEATDEI